MKEKAASNAPFIHWKALMKEIQYTPGIKLLLGSKCLKITNKGVVIEKEGKQELVKADSILIAAGMKSNRTEAETLRHLAPEFRVIGDCSKPANVTEAIHDGYFTAMDF
jgi:thioredoxin reductase